MSIQAALIEIERFSKVFRAFDDVKNSMTELVSLEQNVNELTIKRDSLIDELNGKQLELEDTKEQVKQHNKSFKDKLVKQEEQLVIEATRVIEAQQLITAQRAKEIQDSLLLLETSLQEKTDLNNDILLQIVTNTAILDGLTTKIKTAEDTISAIFQRTS